MVAEHLHVTYVPGIGQLRCYSCALSKTCPWCAIKDMTLVIYRRQCHVYVVGGSYCGRSIGCMYGRV